MGNAGVPLRQTRGCMLGVGSESKLNLSPCRFGMASPKLHALAVRRHRMCGIMSTYACQSMNIFLGMLMHK